MIVTSQAAGGTQATSLVHYHDQRKLTGNSGTGALTCEKGRITATYTNTGDFFVVRRLAAAL